MRGEVVVKYGQGQERVMRAGEHRDFDNATEVTSTGDAMFKVYCDEDHIPLAFLGFGGLVPLALIPAAVEPGGNPVLSTLQP
jgi:hypothetical protein